jgi:Rrf2 family protein
MISKRASRTGFMHFSQRVDYGLLLLVELAGNVGGGAKASARANPTGGGDEVAGRGAFVSLREVAVKNGISFFFLQKVASDLRNAGIVNSDRGKNGGYALAKAAKSVSLREILEAIEGPLNVMQCLGNSPGTSCARSKKCSIRPGLHFINQTIIKALSETSLADLTTNYGQA